MSSKVTVSDFIASYLSSKGIRFIFQLSGGMIAFLSDSIYRLGQTSIINVRHEQAAGFAAEGAARVTGIPSVALATSGPGATNLITAISSAYFDSTPTIFITGQVNQKELRKNIQQRQNGFQELDIVSMVEGVTKYATQITKSQNVAEELEKSWQISIAGRPGPVLIDIPINIQREIFSGSLSIPKMSDVEKISPPQGQIFKLFSKFLEGKNPVILAGGGIRIATATEKFREFARDLRIPVVYSLMGKDSVDHGDPNVVGMIGTYGHRWANETLASADSILVIGSRLDSRQTGDSVESFVKGKYILRVDIDDLELNGRVSADANINMDLNVFFDIIKKFNLEKINQKSNHSIFARVDYLKSKYPMASEQKTNIELNPNFVMSKIVSLFQDANGFLVDVGQHQMWSFQIENLGKDQRMITSGGMGAMGFALPSAIGAALSKEGKWVAITGDGCAQLSLSEIQTIKHYNLDIVIFVINNEQHGMVSQFQDENMNSRYAGTRDGYSAPNFVKVAEAFGIANTRISSNDDFKNFIDTFNIGQKGPHLVEIIISPYAKALPKMSSFETLK